MKTLFTIALLGLSLSAFSADNKEVIHGTAAIEVYQIRCVTTVLRGKDSEFTEITGEGVMGLWKQMNLDHLAFRSERGCDMGLLEELIEPSRNQYGFIYAKAEVTRVTKFGMVGRGEGKFGCQKHLWEDVDLDLGKGVVLKSRESKYTWVDDQECK